MPPSRRLIDFIIRNEGFSAAPYASYEGDSPTVGYGHKVKAGEQFLEPLSEASAMALLMKDLTEAEEAVRRRGGELNPDQLDMLTEFAFSMGPDYFLDFPNFVQAVHDLDYKGMIGEYQRHSKKRPLEQRNEDFRATFLAPLAPQFSAPSASQGALSQLPVGKAISGVMVGVDR